MLSAQESRVVDLIACFGLSDRQIGLAMGIAENTVSEYLRSVMNKLGFSKRIEVAKWRLSRGNE